MIGEPVIKRNAERFPEDFAFRLTVEEKTERVTNCDRFVRALDESLDRDKGVTGSCEARGGGYTT